MALVDKKAPELRFKGFTEDWKLCKLNELAHFSKGSGYTKNDLTESGSPIILYGRLYTNYQTVINNVDTFVEMKDKSVISVGNEVIVPSSGESSEDIARGSVVDATGIILGGDLNVIKPKDEINSTFLALTISNGQQQRELSNRAQGKSIVHLHNSDLKEVNLIFPIINEQKQIGDFFKVFENTITLHQRKLDKTLSVRTGILESLFPSRNDDTPVLRVTHFNSKWNQCNLGDCFDERNEKSQDGELLSVTIDRGVVLTSSLNRVDNSSDDKSNYKLVLPNDIAYNSMRMWQGASGVSNFKGIVSPAYTVLKPKPNISSHFFAYMFKLRHMIQMFEKHSQGLTSDTWNLKFPALSKINVRIPESLEEQTLIVNLLQSVDQTIEYHQNKLVQLKQLKSAYLQKMFI